MHSLYKYSLITIFLISCSSENDKGGIEANLLISPDYQFSSEFFECKLNDGFTLLNLESFLSSLVRKESIKSDGNYDIEVFFPKSNYVNEFILNLKNYSIDDIYSNFLDELSTAGFDEIAGCKFDKNGYKGLSIIDQEFKDPAYVNELLSCNYNEGFNYGTFRVAIDKFANEINNLKIPYEVIYYQTDSSPGSFIWINNFYSKDFSDVISTNWINNPEANEIKNEFEENASCIDAKMYDAFLIT